MFLLAYENSLGFQRRDLQSAVFSGPALDVGSVKL